MMMMTPELKCHKKDFFKKNNIREGLPWWISAGGVGSIPGQGAKIPCAPWPETPEHETKTIL